MTGTQDEMQSSSSYKLIVNTNWSIQARIGFAKQLYLRQINALFFIGNGGCKQLY